MLITANLIMFVIEWAMDLGPGNYWYGGTQSSEVLNGLGSLQNNLWQTRQFFRLLTASFLHYGYSHFLMNMLALSVVGPFVERRLGTMIYAMIYIASGIATMATLACLNRLKLIQIDSLVGASASIMALAGALVIIFYRNWKMIRTRSNLKLMRLVVAILLIQLAADYFTPVVSSVGHFSGMVWGAIFAAALLKTKITSPPASP